ncbi:sensor histidine kinase [Agrococcus baldri]|uniref:histidine kinase n=1 Tax=Agrococcus baldri TaxID=153730 RepID=A0AA87RH76_9MICO|nr:sensor histidine kinase [Agrococcus baldri]GEK79463.1 hypothetical protein ABA31_08140 [Agrococcus baldri]
MDVSSRLRSGEARQLSVAEWIVWPSVSVVIAAISIPLHAVLQGVPLPVAFVLGMLQGGSVLLAALVPWAGALAQLVALIGFALWTTPATGPWPIPVIGIIALAAVLLVVGMRANWLLGAATWGAAVVGTSTIGLFAEYVLGAGTGWSINLVIAAGIGALVLAVVLIARQLRQARRQVAEARQETEQEREQVLWEQERARIAREMHDVVAHSMSLVHMRATSAAYRLEALDEAATAEFGQIADDARSAMQEMRGLLRVLRDPDEVLTAPQPGVERLGTLIDSARSAGAQVEAELQPLEPTPSRAVQLVLYRVAQESVTNALRHAPHAPIALTLRQDGDEIVLWVRNPLVDGAPREGGRTDGHGIRGMRERVASLGGSLWIGPDDGGFLVDARIPGSRPAAAGALA